MERTGIEPVVLPELTEVHLGEWEGGEYRVRVREGDPLAMEVLLQERYELIPGAEKAEDFAARVRAGSSTSSRRPAPPTPRPRSSTAA